MNASGALPGFLDRRQFRAVIERTPLVSVDLSVRDRTSGEILLGLRRNRPAAGFWFVPGGRIRKNETLQHAFTRLTDEELGTPFDLGESRLLGVFEHFYSDCVFDAGVSTHYVVIARELLVERGLLRPSDAQHSNYQWLSTEALLAAPDVHCHTKDYFTC